MTNPGSGKNDGRAETTAEQKRKTGLAQGIGILMLSLLLSALSAEALWRFYLSRRSAPVTVYDEVLGWVFEANSRSRHTSADFDVEIRTDSWGRRSEGGDSPVSGRPASGRPASGRPKVVFVGDSTTFGWGVEVDQSFPCLVGRMLDVEVVNLGVSGYGTDQQLLKLRRDGLPLGPAAVVLTFSHNDLEEVLSEWKYGWTKPRYRFEDSRLILSPAGERSPLLERYSSIYRSLKYYRQLRSRSRGLEEGQLAEARQLVCRLIRSMAVESREVGARFFVVYSGADWLGSALDEQGVDLIDIGAALRETAGREGAVSFPSDPHWNVRGHRVIAHSLRPVLETFLDTGRQN